MLYDTPFNYRFADYRPGIFQYQKGAFEYQPGRNALYDTSAYPTTHSRAEKTAAKVLKQGIEKIVKTTEKIIK